EDRALVEPAAPGGPADAAVGAAGADHDLQQRAVGRGCQAIHRQGAGSGGGGEFGGRAEQRAGRDRDGLHGRPPGGGAERAAAPDPQGVAAGPAVDDAADQLAARLGAGAGGPAAWAGGLPEDVGRLAEARAVAAAGGGAGADQGGQVVPPATGGPAGVPRP